jgi:hypothetical protein
LEFVGGQRERKKRRAIMYRKEVRKPFLKCWFVATEKCSSNEESNIFMFKE